MSTSESPTIVFLNLPPKTFIGVNLASFNSSPNFHGIANLPDGLHLIYTGTDASLSIRQGVWLKIQQARADAPVIILKWSNENEHLEKLDNDDAEAQAATRRLPELRKRGLVDYAALKEASAKLQIEQSEAAANTTADDIAGVNDTDSTDPWPSLTSHVTPRLLTRVLSSNPATSRTTTTWSLTSISSSPSDAEHIPGLSSDEARSNLEPLQTLNLLPIDLKQTWPEDAQGRDRTEKARDRSWYLSHLISQLTIPLAGTGSGTIPQPAAAKELLGELQFCFLAVLCLANYSCLEQWKRLLSMLFTCRSALLEAGGYLIEAVRVLRQQLGQVENVEGGLFELADEQSSAWLRKLLRTFRGNIDEVCSDAQDQGMVKDAGKGLKSAFEELEIWLREKYGWQDENNMLRRGMVQLEDGEMVELQTNDFDEEEESGEYAPVVVDTGLAYEGDDLKPPKPRSDDDE